jgi:hypothetical protein
MIKNFAVITNKIVTNIIIIDDADTTSITHFNAVLIPTNVNVQVDWTYDGVNFYAPVPTLSIAKQIRSSLVTSAYITASTANITVNSIIYSGGFDSAIKLDAAMRLSQAANQTSVTFYDVSNIGHILTLADALTVVIAVSTAYQVALARKQTALVNINNATTVDQVNLINY